MTFSASTGSDPGKKTMRPGEMSLLALSILCVFGALFIAGRAYTPEYAFHAYLFAAASLFSSVAVIVRYVRRPAEVPPQMIGGKPNYNYGPIKFGSIAAIFWGIAGFAVGCMIAFELAFPALNLDLPWTSFGRLRPLHTGLCNLSSGNCIERCSRILASPLYICLCVSAPLFIDFDEDGANEPHERVFIREDPHFGCASF